MSRAEGSLRRKTHPALPFSMEGPRLPGAPPPWLLACFAPAFQGRAGREEPFGAAPGRPEPVDDFEPPETANAAPPENASRRRVGPHGSGSRPELVSPSEQTGRWRRRKRPASWAARLVPRFALHFARQRATCRGNESALPSALGAATPLSRLSFASAPTSRAPCEGRALDPQHACHQTFCFSSSFSSPFLHSTWTPSFPKIGIERQIS